jgi:hypothetical protein
VGGVSGGEPPSAYAIVGPTALKIKTAMIAKERKDARVLPDIDPPLNENTTNKNEMYLDHYTD